MANAALWSIFIVLNGRHESLVMLYTHSSIPFYFFFLGNSLFQSEYGNNNCAIITQKSTMPQILCKH